MLELRGRDLLFLGSFDHILHGRGHSCNRPISGSTISDLELATSSANHMQTESRYVQVPLVAQPTSSEPEITATAQQPPQLLFLP